jgi:hypothetical protein
MSVINNSGGVIDSPTQGTAIIPEGGVEGQILVKQSGADYDVAWSSHKPAIGIEPDDNIGSE